MQLLFTSTEEGPSPCLGMLPGKVTRLKPSAGQRVPHAGWSPVRWRGAHTLAAGLNPYSSWFYFMHSYAVLETPAALGSAEAGVRFVAVVTRGNLFGVQFHPERSGPAGARLLKNFLEQR